MELWSKIGLAAAAVVGGGVAAGYLSQRSAMIAAQQTYARIAAQPVPPVRHFDATQVADLPEIARRYFQHAIAPKTPIYTVAELEMTGTFLLGDTEGFQTYRMTARQALRGPDQFIWLPRLRCGPISVIGSDALVGGDAWTRFWLLGLVPVAQEPTSPDLVRSAQFRAAVESGLWLPTNLLPDNGVSWEQIGPNEAEISFLRLEPQIVLRLTLSGNGAVKRVVGQRWSNANSGRVFRLQPFGGTVSNERSFDGLTIPARVSVGNHYGTDEYLPFFQATIIRAVFR